MKRILGIVLALAVIVAIGAYLGAVMGSPDTASRSATGLQDAPGTVVGEEDEREIVSPAYSLVPDTVDSGETSPGTATIALLGTSVTFVGNGAIVDGTVITITSAGTYTISGVLHDGQIVVDTPDRETVRLVLDGVDITCSASAPLFVANAEKTVITLADGTDNYLTDDRSSLSGTAGSDDPTAAIFSRDDLTINGNGFLTVTANFNHGIACKDDLRINGGRITVTAKNDGIRGRDSITVREATITIQAGGDGMQSNNDEDPEKGYIILEGGTLTIIAKEDGIQAETSLAISGGAMTIATGGGSTSGSSTRTSGNQGMGAIAAASSTSASAKGLKAGVAVTITGGTITIDASDDAIHSDGRILISGGTLLLASGDDGVHADSALEIAGGDIRITNSYEGLESAAITINGGNIHIVARDDGINAAGGSGTSQPAGRQGQNALAVSGSNTLHVTSGYLVIEAGGDGIDVNGPMYMTGGTVIVHGPTSNNNGALDYLGTFTMTGGYLVAAGSSGMAQAPGTTSTQYSVKITLPALQPAGTMIHIAGEDGTGILAFVPAKAYQSVVVSTPGLKMGETYTVYIGGTSTGTVTDGLYAGGTCTGGTAFTSFTVAGTVTTAGSYAGGEAGGMQGGMPGGMPRERPGGFSR